MIAFSDLGWKACEGSSRYWALPEKVGQAPRLAAEAMDMIGVSWDRDAPPDARYPQAARAQIPCSVG